MIDEEIEERLEIMLDPVEGAFDPPRNVAQRIANRERERLLAEPDEDMREIMQDELRSAIAGVVYGGHDPKLVPNEVMLHAIQHPHSDGNLFLHMDARKRVKNPNTAIRAKCLECQGNDQVGVRQCSSFNCMLWPFRMGGNPFYGRLVGSTGEEESNETEEEIEALEAQRPQGIDHGNS